MNSCVYSRKAAWKVAFAEPEDMEGVNERNVMFNVRELDNNWRLLFILKVLGTHFESRAIGRF